MLMFWVTDNFLMYKTPIIRTRKSSAEESLLQRVKVQYRSMKSKVKSRESESDILLTDDEELLDPGPSTPLHRPVVNI